MDWLKLGVILSFDKLIPQAQWAFVTHNTTRATGVEFTVTWGSMYYQGQQTRVNLQFHPLIIFPMHLQSLFSKPFQARIPNVWLPSL